MQLQNNFAVKSHATFYGATIEISGVDEAGVGDSSRA